MKKAVFFAFLCSGILIIVTGCSQQPGTVSVNVNLPKNENTNSASVVANTNSTGEQKLDKETEAPLPTTTVPTQVTVPASLELPVAFASQAPLGVWDALHQEACEEASMIMAVKYFKGEPLDSTIMEDEIQKLIQWENQRGYKVDLTTAETVQILKDYFGLSAKETGEVTTDRIKYELAQGNLVIVPAAGRELKNPYFQTPGPIYHMLLIKGYSSSEFITNDPGTRHGDGFRYSYSRLIEAIHNWDHSRDEAGMTEQEIGQEEKSMVVVEK